MAQNVATSANAAVPLDPSGGKERDYGKIKDMPPGEKIIAKFHPHSMSFLRWYAPSFVLVLWTAVFLIIMLGGLIDLRPLENVLGGLSALAPLIFWFIGAVLVGFILPSNPRTSRENVSARTFLRAVRVFYWVIITLPVILVAWLAIQNPTGNFLFLVYAFALGISALMVLIYDVYRRSFTYYITNFRIIFRYKFFNTVERSIRFSKVEDVEVSRSILQRIFKLGNVRPYSGAEESLVDLTPGYDSPDECFFGVHNPYYVKRILLEQMLGPQDQIQDSVYRIDAKDRQAQIQSGGLAGGPGAATGAVADAERIRRLQDEIEALKRQRDEERDAAEQARQAERQRTARALAEDRARADAERAKGPGAGAGSGSPPSQSDADLQAQGSSSRYSTDEHADFGDDRDALKGSDEGWRGAPRDAKQKPRVVSDDEPEDDKPRSI